MHVHDNGRKTIAKSQAHKSDIVNIDSQITYTKS